MGRLWAPMVGTTDMAVAFRMTVSKKGEAGRVFIDGAVFDWSEDEKQPGPNIVNLITAEGVRQRAAVTGDGEMHFDVFVNEV